MKCSARGTLHGPIGDGLHAFAAWDCRRWKCERCGPRKATRYRIAITRAAEAHRLQRFITLTLDPADLAAGEESKWLTPEQLTEQSITLLRDTWAKFRVLLGRKLGASVPFIAVVELHESGIAHLHVLINQTLAQEWISHAWQSVGGGRIVKIKFVDVHRVSAYLSKYLTKQLTDGPTAKKKRVSTSRSIRLTEKRAGWRASRLALQHFFNRHRTSLLSDVQTDDRGVRWFVLMDQQHAATPGTMTHLDLN